jgi:hypothetical protein
MIHHVWPCEKVLRDGSKVWWELPIQYQGRGGKPVPDCIIDVEDDVRPGFIWNEELQKYAPKAKKPIPKPKYHSDLLEVIAKKLGLSYDDLLNEIMGRKKECKNNIKN